MPARADADTIRILVSTDNHVGYMERDATRGDDSWKSFDEVMRLAKDRDVDMVLLAGDLFHDNQPSRKSMYHVMRSLRTYCYGEKPCELEMLSDATEAFSGAFNHVNYEDQDINVAIPVFSIHGNHDDPSGDGHFAALDILQMSGLINYYGRTPESDNILIKPVLLQKGNTKLALYGMSNVRDERLFRTFRDGNVKFFQPSTQKDDWFNLMSVHQNHHAYTETGYLPETFLPSFLQLVVWGHEHECLIEPRTNPETNFRVMQPGSSVATSLVPGESKEKHIAIVSVKGKDFDVEPIRLKSVRPFIHKEIILGDHKEMRKIAHERDNRSKITRFLTEIVDELIEEAKQKWLSLQDETDDEEVEIPHPLVRLRVEYTAPEGGEFQIENPQRFSNRFVGKVANTNDVIQFHRKRATASRSAKNQPDLPEAEALAQLGIDSVKVERLVKEFLTAQSLTILPQNTFSDAVGQFVDKDDKYAMETFVTESLAEQVKQLLASDENDEVDAEEIAEHMERVKATLEKAFARGELKRSKKGSRKPKPLEWDSDIDGSWDHNPASFIRSDDENDDDDESVAAPPKRGRGGARGGKAAAGTTRKSAAATKAPAKSTGGRGRKKQQPESDLEDDDDDDVIMLDNDDEEEEDDDESQLFVRQTATRKAPAAKPSASARGGKASTRGGKTASTGRQTQLNFTQSQATGPAARSGGRAPATRKAQEPSDDEISDDDAFEPPPPAQRSARTARR